MIAKLKTEKYESNWEIMHSNTIGSSSTVVAYNNLNLSIALYGAWYDCLKLTLELELKYMIM